MENKEKIENSQDEVLLKKEYERLRKNLGLKENYFSTSEQFPGTPLTVNSIGDSLQGAVGSLTPEEALKISLERTLKSGDPVNNISFYDEVNWNLDQLGFPSKNPLDIKQHLLNLINKTI